MVMPRRSSENLNEFRSNLMLLIQNLYPQGLPLPQLCSEYKKYFKHDIKTNRLHKDMGVPPGLGLDENFWARVFSEFPLCSFFYLWGKDEKVIKCIQPRSPQEMKILANLGSYSKIRSLKCVRSKTGRRPIYPPLPHRQTFQVPLTHYQSVGERLEKEDKSDIFSGVLLDKLIFRGETSEEETPRPTDNKSEEPGVPADNQVGDRLWSQHSQPQNMNETQENEILTKPATLLYSLEQSFSLLEEDPTGLMQCKTELTECLVHEEEVETENFPVEEEDDMPEFSDPLETSSESDGSRTLVHPAYRSHFEDQLSSSSISGCSDIDLFPFPKIPTAKVATRVLINHLGEVKIVKFLAVEQLCEFCKKSFPDGGALNCHKRSCNHKQFTCLNCQSSFESKLQLRAHQLFCTEPVMNGFGSKSSVSKSEIDRDKTTKRISGRDADDVYVS